VIEDYIHRIGRTGRAGENGISISFLTYDEDDSRMAKQLISVIYVVVIIVDNEKG
jgi:superfamily II DNA/RNA helicase